jgi:hypothetical protein
MKCYVIRTGEFYGDDGNLLFNGAYAGGNKGRVQAAINNPAYCDQPMIGPLPPGLYTIGEPHEDSVTGTHTMPLTPDAENEMFGRSEFKIHGDNPGLNRSASEGCIVKSPANVRCLAYGHGENRLTVVDEHSDVKAVYASPQSAAIVQDESIDSEQSVSA